MKAYKVSVVIPIYGVERYIERCASSLFQQSLDEIQFVFVNDCTNDHSIDILKRIISKYPSRKDDVLVVEHEQNKGLPQARKSGITYCTGEYIAHCDSDDWPDVHMYEIMYNEAIINNADIVSCDYYRSDGVKIRYIKKIETQKYLQGPVWNKIVRREIYENNDIIYPIANKAEDGALLTQLSFFGQKRVHINKALYYYFDNPDSMCRVITRENCIKRLHEECENVELRRQFLINHDCLPEDEGSLLRWEYLSRKNLMPYILDNEIYELWKNTYPDLNHRLLVSRGVRFQMKVHFLCVYYKQFWILKLLKQL